MSDDTDDALRLAAEEFLAGLCDPPRCGVCGRLIVLDEAAATFSEQDRCRCRRLQPTATPENSTGQA